MGRVTVVGGCRAKAPSTGVLASALPVGTVVKLMEGGTAVEYLVVNQGIPSNSDLYDASCNGTWLLRKDCYNEQNWNNTRINTYNTSTINTWLNGTFFNLLGNVEKSIIKQIKIPYCEGNSSSYVYKAGQGLSTKIFLLGAYELGWTVSMFEYFPVDGAKLSYFRALETDSNRIAKLNNVATKWWTRSVDTNSTKSGHCVDESGYRWTDSVNRTYSIRPALILPFTAKFDKTTMLLKGIA